MSFSDFDDKETMRIVQKIKTWFEEELGEEIGQFDAEFLLKFFAREIGPHFYNQGLRDAEAIFDLQCDRAKEEIYAKEESLEPVRD